MLSGIASAEATMQQGEALHHPRSVLSDVLLAPEVDRLFCGLAACQR